MLVQDKTKVIARRGEARRGKKEDLSTAFGAHESCKKDAGCGGCSACNGHSDVSLCICRSRRRARLVSRRAQQDADGHRWKENAPFATAASINCFRLCAWMLFGSFSSSIAERMRVRTVSINGAGKPEFATREEGATDRCTASLRGSCRVCSARRRGSRGILVSASALSGKCLQAGGGTVHFRERE